MMTIVLLYNEVELMEWGTGYWYLYSLSVGRRRCKGRVFEALETFRMEPTAFFLCGCARANIGFVYGF
jgi:hypothetical protein